MADHSPPPAAAPESEVSAYRPLAVRRGGGGCGAWPRSSLPRTRPSSRAPSSPSTAALLRSQCGEE